MWMAVIRLSAREEIETRRFLFSSEAAPMGIEFNPGSGMRGLIAILGVLTAVPASAHDQWINGGPIPDWVKSSCCGPADAHHLTPDQVHRYSDYYRVDGYRRPIPISVALPSQDGEYWIFYRDKDGAPGVNGAGIGGQSGVYCFFVPMAF
jgi:hypothetical protein